MSFTIAPGDVVEHFSDGSLAMLYRDNEYLGTWVTRPWGPESDDG